MLIILALLGCGEVAREAPKSGEGVERVGDAPSVGGLPENGDELLFDSVVVHDFALELSGESLVSLAANPQGDVPVTFNYAGRSYTAGLHLRGNMTFRTLDGKPSFKIDFHEYYPDQTLGGVRRLTLANMIQDGSMLRAEAAYWFFRSHGLPAPRHGYARVTVNGEAYGLYGVVETLDEQFYGNHFASNDGNSYGGGYGADIRPGCADLFELEESSGGLVMPYSDLEQLIDAYGESDDVLEFIETWFDADMLLRYFAIEMAMGQADGYVSYANNFTLYFDPSVSKWAMIPWGADQAFVSNDDAPFEELYGELAVQCSWDSDCRARLEQELVAVLDSWSTGSLFEHVAAVREVIGEDCENDPRRELPCERDQEKLLDYIEDRPDDVLSDL